MKELLHLIGATTNTSTAYHPRTDGQSERSNQFLGQFLRPWGKRPARQLGTVLTNSGIRAQRLAKRDNEADPVQHTNGI
jgi:hypothetical protein